MVKIPRTRNMRPVPDVPPADPTNKFAIQRVTLGDYLTSVEKGFNWMQDYTHPNLVTFGSREAAQHYMLGLPAQAEQLCIVRLPVASALLKR